MFGICSHLSVLQKHRILERVTYDHKKVVAWTMQQTNVENFFSADSTIFDVFSIQIANGSTEMLLTKPEDVIISANSALKYFGELDVVGKSFRSLNDQEYIIRAVFKDFPSNSHIHPNFIASSLSSQLNQELTIHYQIIHQKIPFHL